MKTFRKTIEFFNKMKDIDIWGDKNEGLSDDEKEYIDVQLKIRMGLS
jgi:hypothetical protein